MLLESQAHNLLQVPWNLILEFIVDLQTNYYYDENPYHSFDHALDMTIVLYFILTQLKADRFFEPIDKVALLIAGLCHDIKHPGSNNQFQTKTSSDLSYLYAGQSVLENYSCSCAFSLIESKYNLLQNLENEQKCQFKELIESVIQMTDMASHFKLQESLLEMIYALFELDKKVKDKRICKETTKITLPLSKKNRFTVACSIVHMADISNPCRPFHVSKKWSDLVIEEFYSQGDREKDLGLDVSPNMDREKGDQVQISLGFSDFIVGPFIEALVVLLDADSDNTMHRSSLELKRESLDLDCISSKSECEKNFCDFFLGGLMLNRAKWIEIKDKKSSEEEAKLAKASGNHVSEKDFFASLLDQLSTVGVSGSKGNFGSSETKPITNFTSSNNTTIVWPFSGRKVDNSSSSSFDIQKFSRNIMSQSLTACEMKNQIFSAPAGEIAIENSILEQERDPKLDPSSMKKSISSRKYSFERSPENSKNNVATNVHDNVLRMSLKEEDLKKLNVSAFTKSPQRKDQLVPHLRSSSSSLASAHYFHHSLRESIIGSKTDSMNRDLLTNMQPPENLKSDISHGTQGFSESGAIDDELQNFANDLYCYQLDDYYFEQRVSSPMEERSFFSKSMSREIGSNLVGKNFVSPHSPQEVIKNRLSATYGFLHCFRILADDKKSETNERQRISDALHENNFDLFKTGNEKFSSLPRENRFIQLNGIILEYPQDGNLHCFNDALVTKSGLVWLNDGKFSKTVRCSKTRLNFSKTEPFSQLERRRKFSI